MLKSYYISYFFYRNSIISGYAAYSSFTLRGSALQWVRAKHWRFLPTESTTNKLLAILTFHKVSKFLLYVISTYNVNTTYCLHDSNIWLISAVRVSQVRCWHEIIGGFVKHPVALAERAAIIVPHRLLFPQQQSDDRWAMKSIEPLPLLLMDLFSKRCSPVADPHPQWSHCQGSIVKRHNGEDSEGLFAVIVYSSSYRRLPLFRMDRGLSRWPINGFFLARFTRYVFHTSS